MNKFIILFSLIVLSIQSIKIAQSEQIDLDRGFIPSTHNLKIQQHSLPEVSELPSEFFWGNVNGKNYLTLVMNQNNPNYCGASWAFSVTSALSDRIKIMRDAAWPDVNLAPQVLLSCSYKDYGCIGGDPLNAYDYIQENSISDQTCSVYQALGYEQGLTCTDELKCGDCTSSKGCWAVEYYDSYTISSYGKLNGESQIMNEIQTNGPITCVMANTVELYEYKGGIFSQKTESLVDQPQQAVSIVGWGEENGTPYWTVRNSNGEYWGENGFFRIQRGSDNLGIEENCSYGVVENTWSVSQKNEKQEKLDGSYAQLLVQTQENLEKVKMQRKEFFDFENDEPCSIKKSGQKKELIKSPQPYEYISDLPDSFDWRDVNGTNYMTWTVNQHIPRYCGSCWAQAASASLADRLNIQKGNVFPQQAFSVQSIVNCRGGGTCNGGEAIEMYEFVNKNGIPPQSCQQYTARNPSVYDCSDIQRCSNCLPTKYGTQICYPVEEYEKVYASEYGHIEAYNHEALKAEIMARGPVSCTIYSTQAFHAYTGGIFAEYIPDAVDQLNHEIQVLGWGNDHGIPYWIGRNSWGTYWGEQGFFKILAEDDFNLAITSSCTWAVPTTEKP